MTDILVTIRLDSGETERHQIAYVPMLEAAYAATRSGHEAPPSGGWSRLREGDETPPAPRGWTESQAPASDRL